ncbi:molybdopterin oxidoreductase family protein [Hyalangium rubrum]|uniref:Molybdopterin oxidoreductase family protein n=1 Tax=Hyalangium rubrum TaxID=3103134 RepID=A0ABU5H3H9_9BACT|nr:molybdopterin oxidoreductase family protein [Hyalangium sp. s54d21]MDY7226645.1 molybdopterin oxidoreductase family protein [Hyalangium sp. s54d21]
MATPAPGTQTHFRTCNLCEAMCGVRIEVAEGRITSIRGDEQDPFSRGHICPKAVALKDLHEDPDRLRQPMRRTASGWEPISWEAALDEAAGRLHELQHTHGRDAVATYLGNPTVHNHGALLFIPQLLRTLRTRNSYSATSVDQLPHLLASYLMFGHQLLVPIPDLDRTGYLLALGANPLASNGSMMTAPDVRERLRAIQKRGGRVVVVDPRRTETAGIADEHLFIRPGTDALFLFALLHELLERPRLERLAPFTEGLERVRELARAFTPERASGPTGVPAESIRRIAREFAEAPAGVCYGRVGTSTQAFGALCQWLINVINVVSGNLDREGGAMFTLPAFDLVGGPRALSGSRGGFARWRSRVRQLPEFAGELPVAALAEEILTEGAGQVRGLLTFAGNPVLSTPNGKQLERALGKLDFMVSVDPYLNETTRHAHLILPPPSPLERGHYDVAFHALAIRNTAKYAPALFEPGPGAMHDWRILMELQHRVEVLRHGRSVRGTLKYEALKRMGPEGILDVGLRAGPYGLRARGLRKGLGLSALRRAPHGVDLGPLQPCLPGRLANKERRIHLAPEPLVEDVARLRAAFPEDAAPPAEGELLLIGRRHLRDNNSWMHNVPMLMKGKPRCTLMMHPEDARALGLAEGDEAVVTSRVGEVSVPVSVTDEVMRGVVSLPHGYGHRRGGVRLSVAQEHAGASLNDLTDDQRLDALCGNAAFSGVPVRVTLSSASAGKPPARR